LRGPSGSGERGRDRGDRALHVVAETSRWVIARRTFGVAVSETPTPAAAISAPSGQARPFERQSVTVSNWRRDPRGRHALRDRCVQQARAV
jgi:hypothetical protein